MNWLQKISQRSSLQTDVVTDDGGLWGAAPGTQYFAVFGPGTYDAREMLYRLGFRWKNERRMWVRVLQDLMYDINAQQGLSSLGVTVPNMPSQQPQQRQRANWLHRGTNNATWYLATMNSNGQPVATTKGTGGWKWVDQNGNSGFFTDEEVRSRITSVRDENQRPVSGASPEELFQMSEDRAEEQQTQNAPGRIPRERISEHQLAVESTFTETDKNITMNALAGSGKTTMLRDLASYKDPREKWLYLVFNKKNQIESSTGKGKFPNGVEVLTSHAFLGRVLGKTSELGQIPQTGLWSDRGERISKMLDNMLEFDNTFPRKLQYSAKKIIKQLASLAKAYAIQPQDQTATQQIQGIIQQYDIDTDISTETENSPRDYTPELIDKTLDLLHFCLPGNAQDPELSQLRDHDDTLWYAAIQPNIKWPKYDVVLADEVQDFNRCQMLMLQKLADQGARIVAVGDPNQSLYMFRGADANAFSNIQQLVTSSSRGGVEHELPTNYRSGRKIIQFVNENTKVTNLQAGRNHEGLVTTDQKKDDALLTLQTEWSQNHKFAQQTAMIARMNKPLVLAALELMQLNMNFVIIGRDFSKELTQHVEKVIGVGRRQNNYPIDQLGNALNQYEADVSQRWAGHISKSAQLQEIQEATESLNSVLQYLQSMNYHDADANMTVRDSVGFVQYLRKRFGGVNLDTVEGSAEFAKKDPRSFITLTTAHRSKGLEFDRVFILEPELFPHPKAKTPEALGQEDNAWYVALTRAMNELHIVQSDRSQ